MATFVLVHGSGGGGWYWQPVAWLLRAAGSEVYTPTLTGVGDRSHLADCAIDLNTHIKDVANLLFYEDLTDVILVGHSYGGMVITGVAAAVPERLDLLVYLDAYLPDEGQSEADLWPAPMRRAMEADESVGRGQRPLPPPAFFGITDPEMADWVSARTTPHPMATYKQAPPVGGAETAALERVYVHCTAGQTAACLRTLRGQSESAWLGRARNTDRP